MSRLTKSHPVARAMRSGLSMKQAWAQYRGGGGVRRRNGRRRSSNPLIATLSNPLGGIGAILGKVPVVGKSIAASVSKENLKKGVTVGVTIGGAVLLPTYLVEKSYIDPTWQAGWKSLVATGLAGVGIASLGGLVMKGSVPLGLASAAGAVVLQLILTKGKEFLGLGDFLTQANGRLGQVPAGLIGDFMTVKRPFAALPGGGLGGLASGQKFSSVF